MKWNNIKAWKVDDETVTPEQKGKEFDGQWEENGGNKPPVDNNPYSKENFEG